MRSLERGDAFTLASVEERGVRGAASADALILTGENQVVALLRVSVRSWAD